MSEALRRCPHAIVVRHHMDRYAEASRGFFAILDDYSPEVEGLSFDEAFLDLTGSERLLGPAREVGVKIKRFANGDLRPVPGAMWILLAAGVLTAVIFGVNKTLMR